MKQIFAFLATALFGLSLQAQSVTPCDELFLSEYVEGSRNNKALEIYNPTNRTINLKDYRVTRWQNGSATWSGQYSDLLYGTIEPNTTKVLVLDKRDTTKTGLDTPVVAALRMKGDIFLSPIYEVSYSMYFNGDDAMSLDRYYADFNTWVTVDIMGKIGERPPFGGWSDSFPYNTGLGKWYTSNHTLVRKRTVLTGIDTIAPVRRGVTTTVPQAANPLYFDPSAEWELYPIDFFDSLGSHDCGCLTLSKETVDRTIRIFPNPANDVCYIETNQSVVNVSVYDLKGMRVPCTFEVGASGLQAQLNLQSLTPGLWLVEVQLANGARVFERIQK